MILQCTCEHRFQDRVYGRGRRVMNQCKPKQPKPSYRCTVCLRVVDPVKVVAVHEDEEAKP